MFGIRLEALIGAWALKGMNMVVSFIVYLFTFADIQLSLWWTVYLKVVWPHVLPMAKLEVGKHM